MPKEKVILKDILFNKERVEFISDNIKKVYTQFDNINFVENTINQFPKLELKERIYHIRNMLTKYLPSDFKKAVNILIQSLPKELNPENIDDDFGYFILSPYGEYIAEHGCNDLHLDYSLSTFEIFTKRFSMEFSIRPFLKKYPKETLKYAEKWSKDNNYHVRRFASEGIRPNLPWGGKVDIGIKNTIDILCNLYTDKTQYVLRSVANNLNDITKLDSDAVIEQLIKWQKEKKQTDKNMKFLIQHALRSEVKSGNMKALKLVGYDTVDINLSELVINTPEVKLGESLEFSFKVNSNKKQKLLINYHIYFVMSNGKLSHKVFNISKKQINPGEEIIITKKHPLREMTTKKLYTGTHEVEIVINGKLFSKKEFEFIGK